MSNSIGQRKILKMNLDIWNDYPDIRKRIEKIIAHQRQLQRELGIEPLTLEQRAERYKKRKQEEDRLAKEQERRMAELAKFNAGKKQPVMPRIKR